ncbi:MAG: alpha/beta fold hydrolase [Deltaproteobacteria bacterium]|nr:alpha/beta fold hydrolase [Deltaproteobacteria bacterium]
MRRGLCGLALGAALIAGGGCLAFQQQRVEHAVGEPGVFQFVEIDGVRLHLRDSGGERREAVLLIHGYASSLATWNENFSTWADVQRVIGVDLMGFGESDKPDGDYSPAAQAALLFKLLERLGVDRVHLVAHSWGCSIALAMALAQPARVGRIVLLSAWVYEDQLPLFMQLAPAPGVGEALYALYYREQTEVRLQSAFFDQRHVSEGLVDAVKAAYDRPGAVAAAHAAARDQSFSSLEARYPEIAHETLLIWGREDRTSGVEVGERLDGELPQARLVVLPRVGHFPMIERAAKVNRLVSDFLAEAVASTRPASSPGAESQP